MRPRLRLLRATLLPVALTAALLGLTLNQASSQELPKEARQSELVHRAIGSWNRWVDSGEGNPADVASAFINVMQSDHAELHAIDIIRLRIARELLAPTTETVPALCAELAKLPTSGEGFGHPWNLFARLIEGLVTFGRIEEAVEVAQYFHKTWPAYRYPRKALVAILNLAGRYQEALPHLVHLLENNAAIFGSHYRYIAASSEDSQRTRFFASIHLPMSVSLTQIGLLQATGENALNDIIVHCDLPEVELWAMGAAKANAQDLFDGEVKPTGSPKEVQGKGLAYLKLRLDLEEALLKNDLDAVSELQSQVQALLYPLGAADTEPAIWLALRCLAIPASTDYDKFASTCERLTKFRQGRLSNVYGSRTYAQRIANAGLLGLVRSTYANLPTKDFLDNAKAIGAKIGNTWSRYAILGARERFLRGEADAKEALDSLAEFFVHIDAISLLGPDCPTTKDAAIIRKRINQLVWTYSQSFPGIRFEVPKDAIRRFAMYRRSLSTQQNITQRDTIELPAKPASQWDMLAELHTLAQLLVENSDDQGLTDLKNYADMMQKVIDSHRLTSDPSLIPDSTFSNADFYRLAYDIIASKIENKDLKLPEFPTSPLFPESQGLEALLAKDSAFFKEGAEKHAGAKDIVERLKLNEVLLSYDLVELAIARVLVSKLEAPLPADDPMHYDLQLLATRAIPVGPIACWHLEQILRASESVDPAHVDRIIHELLDIEAEAASRFSFSGSSVNSTSFYSNLDLETGWGFPHRFMDVLGKESRGWKRILQAAERQYPRLSGNTLPLDGSELNALAWSCHLLQDRAEPMSRLSLWGLAIGDAFDTTGNAEHLRFTSTSAPMDTYANLLADLGRLDEAIAWQTRAVQIADGNDDLTMALARMKAIAAGPEESKEPAKAEEPSDGEAPVDKTGDQPAEDSKPEEPAPSPTD